MGRVAESACSGDIRVGGAVWSSVGNILSGYIVGFIGIKCRLFFGLLPLRWLLSLDNNGREILWLSMMSYLVIFSFVILRASKFSNAYANVFYKESRGRGDTWEEHSETVRNIFCFRNRLNSVRIHHRIETRKIRKFDDEIWKNYYRTT